MESFNADDERLQEIFREEKEKEGEPLDRHAESNAWIRAIKRRTMEQITKEW